MLLSFQLRYLHEPVVNCLQGIDMLEQKDLQEKAEVLLNVSQTIPQFSRVSIRFTSLMVYHSDEMTSLSY